MPALSNVMLDIVISARNAESSPQIKIGQVFTSSQGHALQCLALTFSTISVASSILAFYWFIKMRRTFRHDLIMLLIQSDMFKSLWFMIFPGVVLTLGPVSTGSAFCQVSGFFLTIGIEASDVAVLLIAIHAALYIFTPKTSSREGGLYPYRHFAYGLWILFPIMMASLGFIDGKNAYIDQSTYCYLPVRPFWYRLALSWIPRYIVFVSIIGIYAAIYLYFRREVKKFDEERDKERELRRKLVQRDKGSKRAKRLGLPPTPPLIRHGLIPESSRQNSQATDLDDTRGSISTLVGSDHNTPLATGTSRFIWASVFGRNGSSSEARASEDVSSIRLEYSSDEPQIPRPMPVRVSSVEPPDDIEFAGSSPFRIVSWQDNFISRVPFTTSQSPSSDRSSANIFDVLGRGPPDLSTESQTPISQLQLIQSAGHKSAIIETREKIRRQLRLSFVYPLVYMAVWIVPFVNHITQWNNRYAVNPPFGLVCASIVVLCVQGTIDCLVFSSREKPWKHIPGSDGTFCGSLKFWSDWNGVRKKRNSGPGRTRDEMIRDSRTAYQRREEELAQRRLDVIRNYQLSQPDGHRREWWEDAGMDGSTDKAQIGLEDVKPESSKDEIDSTVQLNGPVREEEQPRGINTRALSGVTIA